jgi:Ser/Thr protein kinase RdoA (MazF antagonist)
LEKFITDVSRDHPRGEIVAAAHGGALACMRSSIVIQSENHFPVLRSVLSADALALLLADAYGFAQVRCQLIKAVVLDTYHVATNDGPYIFRVYPRRRTVAEIMAELDFLAHLHSNSVSVSVPVARKNGERLLTIHAPEGDRCAALFTFAPGVPLHQNIDAASARAFGAALAHIHTIADTLPHALPRQHLDLQFLLDRPLAELDALGGTHIADWIYLREVADVITPRIAALPTTAPHYGFCHGDAGSANAHIAADGQLTFFDFDFCGPSWRMYDVGTFLIDEPDEVSRAFLKGYQQVRALMRDELETIPLFQLAQNIWMLGTRASYINEWGSTHFTDAFVGRVLTFIRKTMEQVRLV